MNDVSEDLKGLQKKQNIKKCWNVIFQSYYLPLLARIKIICNTWCSYLSSLVFIVGEREFINLFSNPVFIDVVSTPINNLLELDAASKESF